MVNVELLRKEIEFISSNQDKWDQEIWVGQNECGTVACLAGWTVIHKYDKVDNLCINYSVSATTILGLTRKQTNLLFSIENTLQDIWRIANEITDGEIEIPIEYLEESRGTERGA